MNPETDWLKNSALLVRDNEPNEISGKFIATLFPIHKKIEDDNHSVSFESFSNSLIVSKFLKTPNPIRILVTNPKIKLNNKKFLVELFNIDLYPPHPNFNLKLSKPEIQAEPLVKEVIDITVNRKSHKQVNEKKDQTEYFEMSQPAAFLTNKPSRQRREIKIVRKPPKVKVQEPEFDFPLNDSFDLGTNVVLNAQKQKLQIEPIAIKKVYASEEDDVYRDTLQFLLNRNIKWESVVSNEEVTEF